MDKKSKETLEIRKDLIQVIGGNKGHYLFESGHHGDIWFDLDESFIDVNRLNWWVSGLADQLNDEPDFICGPLTGGAFIAQLLALKMQTGFIFTERTVSEENLITYQIPKGLRKKIQNKTVLLVDDIINAASAISATYKELQKYQANITEVACLLISSDEALTWITERDLKLTSLATLKRNLWKPQNCPLCKEDLPLVSVVN